jgi:hypothetical protein
MPEPWPFLKATAVAAALGFVIVAAASWFRRATNEALIGLVAIAIGFAGGCYVFPIDVKWPPFSGLDRFLLVLLPAAFFAETVAHLPRVPAWCIWILRAIVAAGGGIVLLYNSVYLTANSPWPFWQMTRLLVLAPLVLIVEWWLLWKLEQRSPNIATRWNMAIAIVSAGMMVMLGGYIKGGAVAFPFSAAIVGASLWPARSSSSPFQSGLGFSLVGLFGVLFVGQFFGQISLVGAIVVLLSPLLGWASELLPKRFQKPWQIAAVRIAVVAIPLVVVMTIAKRDFDRRMGPLLAATTVAVRA